jgi:spore coat protein CotH
VDLDKEREETKDIDIFSYSNLDEIKIHLSEKDIKDLLK